jgi:hypothetical protein
MVFSEIPSGFSRCSCVVVTKGGKKAVLIVTADYAFFPTKKSFLFQKIEENIAYPSLVMVLVLVWLTLSHIFKDFLLRLQSLRLHN